MIQFIKKMFGLTSGSAINYRELLNQGAIIVDVRTPAEYKSGHIEGAVNIPLDIIAQKALSLKAKNVPVITCCRSGARSGMAAGILKGSGIEVVNGGAWDSLERRIKG